MKLLRTIWLVILLAAIISACATPTAIQTQAPNPAITDDTQYPGPVVQATIDTSYPAPATAIPGSPEPTWTTDPQMGSVTGKLLLNGKGVKSVTFYLAEIMKDATGKDIVAGLDRVNSPNTATNEDGVFTFINVNPGRYALILDVVTTQYMINYPDKNTPIIVDVTTGKEIDLGNLDYDTLPIQQ